MVTQIWLHAFVILLLTALSSLLTMTKVALVMAQRGHESLRELGDIDQTYLSKLLMGVRSGTIITLMLAGVYFGLYARDFHTDWSLYIFGDYPGGEQFIFWSLAFLTAASVVVFGESIPRRLTLLFPLQVYRLTHPIARFATWILTPFVKLSELSNNTFFKVGHSCDSQIEQGVTEEEVRYLLERATESGAIHPAEQQILSKVFRFSSRSVNTLMTPRNDIIWLDCEDSVSELWRIAHDSGFSHFPVMRSSIDDIIGIVSIGDLAEQFALGVSSLDTKICRDVLKVPATTQALSLLNKFKQDKYRFALVIDEYGGIDGLITTHDLMEALVGEIGDGELARESTIVKRDDGSFLVDASVDLEDMMDRICYRLPIERERKGFYSLGGLVMEQLGHVPATGESFNYGGLHFEVVDMDGYRIDKVLVQVINSSKKSIEPRKLEDLKKVDGQKKIDESRRKGQSPNVKEPTSGKGQGYEMPSKGIDSQKKIQRGSFA